MPLFTAALMVKRWRKENEESWPEELPLAQLLFSGGHTFQEPIHDLTVSRESGTRSHVPGELHFHCSWWLVIALAWCIHHHSGHLTPCQLREDILAPVQEERHSSRQPLSPCANSDQGSSFPSPLFSAPVSLSPETEENFRVRINIAFSLLNDPSPASCKLSPCPSVVLPILMSLQGAAQTEPGEQSKRPSCAEWSSWSSWSEWPKWSE